MTGADDSEMREVLALAARLGRDPLVIQGAGGNISLKRDDVMWVKASGTWMAEAMERSILISIDTAAAPLASDDEAQLPNWDAEKYRQSLDARTP